MSDPVASPDGHRIAFVWNRGLSSESGDSLYLMNADGSAVTPIGAAPRGSDMGDLAWAPDGRVAFSYRPTGASGGVSSLMIAVLDTAGSAAATVGRGMSPSWSPDGRWLAFVKPTEATEGYARTAALAMVRADGSHERLIFANSDTSTFSNGFEWIRNGTPVGPILWDPKGAFLVFSRLDNGGTALWRVNTDGTKLRQLTRRVRPQSN
jgi:Tol biopolymer transport system component